MKTEWLAALALAFTGHVASAMTLEGPVVSVKDGDTVTVLVNGREQHNVRLAGIDAPEVGHGAKKPGQPYGYAAKQVLADLVFNKTVRAECGDIDRYQRKVCDLYLGQSHINGEMVARGYAWVYRQYVPAKSLLIGYESSARNQRIGLWADDMAVPPWDWRHKSWAQEGGSGE